MERKITFYDRTDTNGDALEVEVDHYKTTGPVLYFGATPVGANLDYAQVLKLRDVLNEWLSEHFGGNQRPWVEE